MSISSPKKILAIKLRSLGDTVLMTAPLNELRKAFPQAEIHVAVTSTWAPLLESHPAIHTLWKYERYEERAARAKAATKLALKLRKQRFDCVLNFHASPSSAMISFATGARARAIHFHGHKDRNRYSTLEVPGKGILKPIIERDMDTVRALGVHVPSGRLPQIYLQAGEKERAREWLARLGLPSPLMLIGLGASRSTKRWPTDRFASLAVEWASKKSGGVLAIAGPGESKEVFEFLKAVDDLLLIAIPDAHARATVRSRISSEHQLPLRQLAAITSQASVFAGNDSGPRHIAVAVQTPTVTLFGPEHPFEWHPYPTDRHPYLFIDGLSCRKDALPGYPAWCGVDPCLVEEHKCLRSIGVDQVFAECDCVAAASSGTQTMGGGK
jgi:ADP-heptose:LPS heptosyltransferase